MCIVRVGNSSMASESIYKAIHYPGLGVYKVEFDELFIFFRKFNISSIFRYPRYIFMIASFRTPLYSPRPGAGLSKVFTTLYLIVYLVTRATML